VSSKSEAVGVDQAFGKDGMAGGGYTPLLN